MKIQLDTENKTIRLENSVELAKLIETLDRLLPNKEWKKFTLETNTVINHWSSPIVIEKYIQPWKPYDPWQPWYYGESNNYAIRSADYSVKNSNSSLQMKSGVYNIEA